MAFTEEKNENVLWKAYMSTVCYDSTQNLSDLANEKCNLSLM